MFNYSEMEIWSNDDFSFRASKEDVDFYKDELDKIRSSESDIIVAWIVPDSDIGHIEYQVFETWDDAEIWKDQR